MLTATPVPALSDNYIWLLRTGDEADRRCVIVDPGEADAVLTAIRHDDLEPVAVLITHHHHDHVGGLAEVSEAFPDIPVYGPAGEPVAGVTRHVDDGDRIEIPGFGAFEVIGTPGHTLGHIAFHGESLLLCGDTLFAGGCGRVFEGSHAQMSASLDRLAQLPDDTRGCCGHEYTLSNLAFAEAVEPDNVALGERLREARAARDAGRPTLPFTLAAERETNPFLRCDEPAVRQAAEAHAGHALSNRVAVFGVLREWKNRF